MRSILTGLFFILLALSAFSACDDVDLEGVDAGEVRGLWQTDRGAATSRAYLFVSDTDFNFYTRNTRKNCFTTDAYQVVRVDGTGFFIVNKVTENATDKVYAVSRNRDRIDVRDIDDTQAKITRYFESTIGLERLVPECYNTALTGIWENVEDEQEVYIDVSETTIEVTDLDTEQACYTFLEFEVVAIDGEDFSIRNTMTSDEENISLAVQDSVLNVQRTEEGEPITLNLRPSTVDPDTLSPMCSINTKVNK